MHRFAALLGGVLVGAVQAVAVRDDSGSAGCNVELAQCFSSSQSQASAYCTQTMSLATGTDIVTVTPTVTVTETIVATVSPSDIDHLPAVKRIKRRGVCTKRDVKIDCLSTATATATSDLVAACSCIGITASPQVSTADPTTVTVNVVSYTTGGNASPESCAASVIVSTLTQTETPSASVHVSLSTVTEVETATVTETPSASIHVSLSTVTDVETTTVTESSVQTETATETQTETRPASVYVSTITEIETRTQTQTQTETAVTSLLSTITEVHITTETTVSTYSYPQTVVSVSLSTVVSVETETVVSTSVQVSTTTTTETSTPTDVPQGLVKNGNFEGNSLDGWSVLNRVGSGDTESVVTGGVGGKYCLDIFTNYFARNAAASVTFGQIVACTAGKKYRLTFNYAVVSSYTNGNAWSVVLGGVTIVSGAGASVAWSSATFTHTCGATTASNQLELRGSSSTSRQAHFQFDNFDLYPLETVN